MKDELYLHLSHGRKTPEEQLDDWGPTGPTFGPYDSIHTTYACEINMQYDGGMGYDTVQIIRDMVYYDGMYYGDWEVNTTVSDLGGVRVDETKTRPTSTLIREDRT